MSQTTGEPPPVDARYAEAVRKQREALVKSKQLAKRRAPILRLVSNQDEAEGRRGYTVSRCSCPRGCGEPGLGHGNICAVQERYALERDSVGSSTSSISRQVENEVTVLGE
jgi:hypothetical protein